MLETSNGKCGRSEGRPKTFGHTGLLRPDDGGRKSSRKEGRTQKEPSELDTRSPGEERVTRHDYRVNYPKFLFVVRELRFWPCVRTLSSTHNAGLKGRSRWWRWTTGQAFSCLALAVPNPHFHYFQLFEAFVAAAAHVDSPSSWPPM